MKKRILYSNNTVISDMTANLDKFQSGVETVSIVAAEDYIYIGSILPFNHIYIDMGSTVNDNVSAMTVAYWDSGAFRDAVNLIDETSSSSKTLAQSGHVSWTPDRDYSWIREDTNYSGNSVTGLTTVEIYDMYWARLAFSADLTTDMNISWIGQIFSDDDDLGAEHADLIRSGFMTAFEAGKADWKEQHVIAGRLMINDLIKKKEIVEGDQILSREDLREASVKKVAQIIYNGMGNDYSTQRDDAKKEYKDRINTLIPKVDKNKNARLDRNEQHSNGRLYR